MLHAITVTLMLLLKYLLPFHVHKTEKAHFDLEKTYSEVELFETVNFKQV